MPVKSTLKPKGEPMLKRYIGAEDTAALLRTTKVGIYQMINRKQLPHIKVGKRLLFDPEDLEQWVNINKVAVRKRI
jgi:excisionase family DNA binding protein